MAQFIDPFVGKTPAGTLTKREILRALRESISAEHEAVHLYEAIADACDDERIKKVMQDIANEEKVHAHEFQCVLCLLDDKEHESHDKAKEELEKLLGAEALKPLDEAKSDTENKPAETPDEPKPAEPEKGAADTRGRTILDLLPF